MLHVFLFNAKQTTHSEF